MLGINLQKSVGNPLFWRAVRPYCACSLLLSLTFFALDIFPDCPNITSWCSQAPKLPCRVKAHGNVGYGERLTAPPRAGGVGGQGGDTVTRGGSKELETGTLRGGMGKPGGFLGRRGQGRGIKKEKI